LAHAERDVWDPERYAQFAAERRAPFLDLLAMIEPIGGPRVIDLGCGSGELTRLAHERLGARETVGIDSSQAMLARAAPHAGSGVTFRRGDLADADGGPFDVVLSNAALHWVPEHDRVLGRVMGLLAPGGQLAIQVPANEAHPSHALAREVAREPEHAAALGGWVRESPVLAPEAYASILFSLGVAAQRVRVEIYAHPLPGPEAVVDWVRGTLLTDYERRLPADAYARFLARYRERLLAALPEGRPYLYTYRRIFLWARR
jgi:trans-aconitate 2-methyltransferase